MELIVAVIIGVVAAGAVLAPLVRRDRGGVRAAGGRRSVHVRTPAAAGASRDSQAGDPAESEAGAATAAMEPAEEQAGAAAADGTAPEDPIEREILRYRIAVRAGTVCRRCRQANPEGSRYCSECGSRIAAA